MDAIAIIALAERGLGIVQTLWEAGNSDAARLIYRKVANILSKSQTNDKPTPTEIKEVRDLLDAQLKEFNKPLPPEDEA